MKLRGGACIAAVCSSPALSVGASLSLFRFNKETYLRFLRLSLPLEGVLVFSLLLSFPPSMESDRHNLIILK